MRWSSLFCPTLKEVPRDAEIISHQLMLRAGLIRKHASGLYSFLPAGLKTLNKIQAIVRDELNKTGAQEVVLPLVTPADLWQETGRWDKYGPELLRIKDRHDNDFCFGPTFEEAITDLFRSNVKSYKQLPINLYQIQNKFRDEIRPRFGVMRSREFLMKDAYSFHLDRDDLAQTYNGMKDAYLRIFNRIGLDSRCVAADSGQIGGDVSAEFMVLAQTGEDEIIACSVCDKVANIEAVSTVFGDDITDGDDCPCGCGGTIQVLRGIEVGHIFQLGDTYSSAMNATVLDQHGTAVAVQMGCYGIGIARTMAAAIEQNHDDKGIKWPVSIAPFEVGIVLTTSRNEDLVNAANMLYDTLKSEGVDVIIDDRDVSAGVKFSEADLLGLPIQIVVGKLWEKKRKFELKLRSSSEVVEVDESALYDVLKPHLT